MPSGTALDTGKYRQFFIGRIDEVNQTDVDGGATPIVLECSGLGAWLMDMQIEEGGTRYGEDAGVALEDVLQAILDDHIPGTEPSVTLVKESSSDFAVTAFELEENKVLEEMTKIVLDSVGEDLRYRYDASHVSQLTWFNPDRSRSSVDATISSYRLRKLNMSIANIRNAGELPYIDVDTSEAGTVSSTDSASIAKYRRRFQRMAQSPLLTNETSAQATIDAVINDLSGAEADFEASCPLLWFVQLYDRYTFAADNKTYDSDQTFGVVGYQSAIESGVGQTVIQCSGRIVGAYAEWLKRIPTNLQTPKLDVEVPPLLSYEVRVDDSGADSTAYLTAKVQGGAGTYETRALARIDREPTGDELDDATPSTAGLRTGVFEDIVELKAGKRFYVAGRAYDEDGNGTAVARISEVWLGLDSTPGADVTIGTIVSQADKIIYPVAFDNECAYCEVWIREFTANPGSPYSVENLTPNPYKVLTLGIDAMVPGIEFNLPIPLAGPDNWLMVTFVPFDHLAKRGNIQTKRNKGSRGTNNPNNPTGLAKTVFWWEADGETGYANGDPIGTLTDQSSNGNDAVATVPGGSLGGGSDGTYVTNGLNSLPIVRTVGSVPGQGCFRTPVLFNPATYGATFFLVARRTSYRNSGFFIGFQSNVSGEGSNNANLGDKGDTFSNTNQMAYQTSETNVKVIVQDPCDAFGIVCLDIAPDTVSGTPSITPYFNNVAGTPFEGHHNINHDKLIEIACGGNGGTINAEFYCVGITQGQMTADERNDAHLYLIDKINIGTPPPLDDSPDPPASVVQVGSSASSITVRVTMPATAPDSIRIGVGTTRSYDETVAVAGGATQDFTIGDLSADTPYNLSFRSVVGGLVSTAVSIVGTTSAEGGTLNDPTSLAATYSRGDQAIILTATATGNPRGTQYIVQTSTNPLGPFTGSRTGYNSGSSVTASIPYPQTVSAVTVYIHMFARKVDWTDSGYDSTSVVVPAR